MNTDKMKTEIFTTEDTKDTKVKISKHQTFYAVLQQGSMIRQVFQIQENTVLAFSYLCSSVFIGGSNNVFT